MHLGELLRDDGLEFSIELEDRLDRLMPLQRFLEQVADGQPGAWVRSAACRGMDTGVFFPDLGESASQALAVCATCPVRHACAEWVDGLGAQQHGVAGGATERERRRGRGRRGRAVVPEAEVVGVCEACGLGVSDRLRAGWCSACYVAWRRQRDQGVDQAEFVARRRGLRSAPSA